MWSYTRNCSGIPTHDTSVKAANTHALESAATEIGIIFIIPPKYVGQKKISLTLRGNEALY
jgi:hypothetical protein